MLPLLPTSPAGFRRPAPTRPRVDAPGRTMIAAVVALPPVLVAFVLLLWGLATQPALSRSIATAL